MMGGPDKKEPQTLIEQLDQMIHAEEGETEIWPDMAAAVEVFSAMSDQWNVGPGGVIGLRFEALPVILDAHEIPLQARKGLIADVQIMGRAAVEAMRNGGQ